MAKVFIIYFDHQLPSGEDDERLLGVYSTEQKAEAALARFKAHSEFRDHPECLECGPFTLDDTSFKEGFISVWPGEG